MTSSSDNSNIESLSEEEININNENNINKNNNGNLDQDMSDGEIVDDNISNNQEDSNSDSSNNNIKEQDSSNNSSNNSENIDKELNSNCIDNNNNKNIEESTKLNTLLKETGTSKTTASTTATTTTTTTTTTNFYYIDSETIINENELLNYHNIESHGASGYVEHGMATPNGTILRNSSNGIVTYNTPIESIPYPSIVGDRLYMPLAYSSDQNRKEDLDFEETLRDYKNFKEKKRSRSYSSDRSRSRSRSHSRSRSRRRRHYSSESSRSRSRSRSRSKSSDSDSRSYRYSKKSSSSKRSSRRSRSSSDSRSRSRSSKRYSSSRYSSSRRSSKSSSRYSSSSSRRDRSRSRSRSRSYSRSRRDKSRSRSYSRRRSYSTSSSRSRSRSNRRSKYSKSSKRSYSDSSRSRSRSNRRSRRSKSRDRYTSSSSSSSKSKSNSSSSTNNKKEDKKSSSNNTNNNESNNNNNHLPPPPPPPPNVNNHPNKNNNNNNHNNSYKNYFNNQIQPHQQNQHSQNYLELVGIKPNQQTSFVTFLKSDGSWYDSEDNLAQNSTSPKMHLIVDIDHTLIHSTKDPNGESYFLKDRTVHKIIFPETNETFYVKERPNAVEFLKILSQQFHIYVYSFHPKYYVERVASILDPHSNIFSKVISKEIIESIENIKISKDNNNSQNPFIIFNEINVPKIFKFEELNQLIILDDREDVWRKFQDNLILLDTFKYFNKEIQDFTPIYQYPFSFQELSRAFPFPNITESLNNNNFNNNLNQIIKTTQLQQQQLSPQQPPQPNINFLLSNQPYLDMFSCLLSAMQSEYVSRFITDNTLHIKNIIHEIRSSVLSDCNIVFSGIFPKQIDPSKLCHTRVSKITESFGATISPEIDSKTTHLIFIKEGTSKVLQALKNPNIKVVHFAWLRDCIHRWEHIDEDNYSVTSYQNLLKN